MMDEKIILQVLAEQQEEITLFPLCNGCCSSCDKE